MRSKQVVFIAGVVSPAVYLILTTVAFLGYPAEYSPLRNWLSDLGNPLVNQSGAIFYNLGCILTGVFLIVFFVGMSAWSNGDRKNGIFLLTAQISGILSSLSLIIAALFPLGAHTSIHAVSAKIHVIALGFFLTFSASALLRHPRAVKAFAYFGFLAAVVNFVYGAFLHSVFAIQWVAIGMFIVYVLMIAYNSTLIRDDKIAQGKTT
jgi:hypothetical protein